MKWTVAAGSGGGTVELVWKRIRCAAPRVASANHTARRRKPRPPRMNRRAVRGFPSLTQAAVHSPRGIFKPN
jgi:hypothetical protein